MMDILFFTPVVLYFVATVLQFVAAAFKKQKLKNVAFYVLAFSALVHLVYFVVRGIKAGRMPLSNQFEFASAFSLGIALMGIFEKLRSKRNLDFLETLCAPLSFLLLSYAALQPRDINPLMPALKSMWFTLHIGTAVLSYSAFALAAGLGVRYLVLKKKSEETHLKQIDVLSYKYICFGYLMLTVVILSGCVWAEQAWSTFWSWDPKEVWALITWLIYSVYLHQRIRLKWKGSKMAWFAIIAFVCVLFTFVGVNKIMSGLHSYA